MIVGCGTDIVEIERVKQAVLKWGDNFLKKIFTENEINYAMKRRFSYQHLAARFAAKEAVVKAFGDGFHAASWQDIEIINDTFGKPTVKLYRTLNGLKDKKKVDTIIISMSHAALFAQAIAILERGEK
ncbi:MAG: holo-ACP synthase [Candidatus Omnitrophota bacterium]